MKGSGNDLVRKIVDMTWESVQNIQIFGMKHADITRVLYMCIKPFKIVGKNVEIVFCFVSQLMFVISILSLYELSS